MIAIVDYKAGNLFSVARALTYLGVEFKITDNAKDILGAERVVFPGVGSAGQAMEGLKKTGLDQVLYDFYESGRPFLGICLGTQIILNESEEHNTACLGLVPGTVKRFPAPLLSDDGSPLKVPHMGWNRITLKKQHPVLKDVSQEDEFYFVHSYFPAPEDRESIIGTTDYGIDFASILGKENLIALQFHPEKSGPPGLAILKNFCCWN